VQGSRVVEADAPQFREAAEGDEGGWFLEALPQVDQQVGAAGQENRALATGRQGGSGFAEIPGPDIVEGGQEHVGTSADSRGRLGYAGQVASHA
jgi:hypothetical protein